LIVRAKSTLVVEVDGDVHGLPPPSFGHLPQIPRTWNLGEAGWGLREMGLSIVRVRNDEVVKNLSVVVGKIKEHLN
jgi:very-short-patch-repair endonuclease